MQVTRENFQDVLPTVQEAIRSCDFIAIDTEFSGLYTGKVPREHVLDTHQVRYLKLKDSVENFVLLQFGKLSWFLYF